MIDIKRLGKPGDMKAIVELVNKFQEEITMLVNPMDYHDNIEDFVNMIITALSMPAADMICKLSGLSQQGDTSKYEQEYIDKFKLAVKWRKSRE